MLLTIFGGTLLADALGVFIGGLAGAAAGFIVYTIKVGGKKVIANNKELKKHREAVKTEALEKKISEKEKLENNKLQEQIDEIRDFLIPLTHGMLSIQGRAFKKHCAELLEPNHVISADEWVEIEDDHRAYKSLGGNHNGDTLFDAVEMKYKAQLAAQAQANAQQ